MYKMLIADDEPAVRQYIRYMVEKHQLPFQICGEAADGEQVVLLAEQTQPDLIMMDIEMPLLNGLDAAAAIRRKLPDVVLYILTAYGQFEYAQKALQQHAAGYLLKPSKPAELLAAWKDGIASILRRRVNESRLCRMTRKIDQDRPLLAKQRLLQLLQNEGEHVGALKILREVAGQAEFWPAALISVGCRASAELSISPGLNDRLLLECRRWLGDNAVIIAVGGDVLIISGCWDQKIRNHLERAMELWGRGQGVTLRAGISLVTNPRQIGQNYLEARRKREAGLFWRQQGVLLIDENMDVDHEPSCQTLQRQIRDNLLERRPERVRKLIQQFFAADQWQIRHTGALLAAVRKIGVGLIEQYAGHLPATTDAASLQSAFLEQVCRASTAQALEQYLRELAECLGNYCPGPGEPNQAKQAICWAVDYIQANYHKELTLEQLAEKLFMSSGYFCRIFKKYTGEGFSAYLSDIRLNQAKALLQNGNCTVAEAARLVGFRDASYFSSVFKKKYQQCPSQLFLAATGQES